MTDDRPDPDALLARVQADEVRQSRGRLKIFFGMAPGVGKTYAMLEAARKLAKEGVDVVIGYVEPHARPETYALVLGLDQLPPRSVTYRGKTIQEFDLEAALARHPQILLVDELAHSNAEGSTHAKRWQDIDDLLAAGIDVYTTLNVQHIESLNDVVAQVTMIPVRETVPDKVFERADEVELVDLPPDDLIERLKEGKVYVPAQALRAIENFFRKGNLIALRELSLRKTADRVNAQALDYRQEHDVSRIWPTSERLLVCVGPSPMSARLVRAARRMATTLRAPLTALYVELDQARVLNPADQQRLEQNLRLAEDLGATVAHTTGTEFAGAVLDFARTHNTTKIIVGKPLHGRWRDWWRGAFVYDLIRRCGDIDVYVISGDAEATSSATTARRAPALIPWVSYLWAAVLVGLTTLLCAGIAPLFHPTNLVMVYLATVVGVALRFGRGPSILATVLGVAAFDLFFVAPFGTFAVSDSQYVVTFGVMLVTGLVISELTARVQSHSAAAREREARTAALLSLSKELTSLATRDAVATTARQTIAEALDADVWILAPPVEGNFVLLGAGDPPPQRDDGVIRWVFQHRRNAGAGTDTLPGTPTTWLPLLVTEGIVGALGIRPKQLDAQLTSRQFDLLQAIAGQLAGALERCALAREAESVRLQVETERLRNALLSAVSHDLRTPLATITGAASLLVEGTERLAASHQKELAESILDEADRLNRLVANLLDMTRLEAGAIPLQRELQPIDEVVGVVLARFDRYLREHPVVADLPDDLPPVAIDGLLIQEVLANLLDNALKFSPPGSPIEIRSRREGSSLIVEVADHGPGIPPNELQRIFEKFHRVEGQPRGGTGIGLAICRGIVELHGGTISAANRSTGGAVFRFTLPLTAARLDSHPVD